ncbi:uncharacterized protein MYCFIDRAFT_174407 [Pseudocercospora fijiensis CIRAD86]|uniref:Uncharacterized protein n=1 Tax=Pseudocercospora fijiensis (strain CIRAD86) TaxID=383855 RepID=M3B0F6_PSEFD|nr:uncharacterized protein MYCFIDRAFT_174407 [Pseudocercospora fijiensis CIRAD86]EME82893.1 hypothetical protein MYCFIDRAFT_174407 [Pseudocercospora fijiensis CIRAD86]
MRPRATSACTERNCQFKPTAQDITRRYDSIRASKSDSSRKSRYELGYLNTMRSSARGMNQKWSGTTSLIAPEPSLDAARSPSATRHIEHFKIFNNSIRLRYIRTTEHATVRVSIVPGTKRQEITNTYIALVRSVSYAARKHICTTAALMQCKEMETNVIRTLQDVEGLYLDFLSRATFTALLSIINMHNGFENVYQTMRKSKEE